MEYAKLQDKCRGSIVGGAVGDALGYEVEFMSLGAIHREYGQRGITRYSENKEGVAQFSDDTQMTLFTLEGLMNGIIATQAGKPEEILPYIAKSYLNWHKTQTVAPQIQPDSWLSHIRTLWSRRAPGTTCMNALDNISNGVGVYNNSKGCGGVMRVAPIGIFNAVHSNLYSYEDTAHLAGWAAEITHHHVASTFASALLATTVENCIHDETVSRLEFEWIVDGGLSMMSKYFPGDDDKLRKFCNLVKLAIELGKGDTPDGDAIRQLGEGWVGDEAIAIAIFCVMRHIDSFEDCIISAVNHDGDSDSTGAIAGNIIGAILGYSAIPRHFLDTLEIEPILLSAADDLCAD
ncbi:MAG: ADP-ribosylglycohydrolase family protein, partial [Muribaculaceae bacterium]|nr:ADP-ribosylglycohydrolase family protein [Muribaculaceae bacterium]